MNIPSISRRLSFVAIALALSVPLAACSSGFLPGSGPSSNAILQSAKQGEGQNNIAVVPITPDVTWMLRDHVRLSSFSEIFPTENVQDEYVLGRGDVVKIVLWETPPSLLFGSTVTLREGEASVKSLDLPDQRISTEGTITIPFIGVVMAAGKTPQELERIIVQELKGKANQPQAIVQLADNKTKGVTLVGDFQENIRMPLTSKGERLLDAVAAAGGVKQSVDKVSIQMTRNGLVRSMPMDQIVRDPSQNIQLLPGDVVMAMHQPLSLSVLGALQKNEELRFETQGITLTQAIARAGGLSDTRADIRGIFVFRMEDAGATPDTAPKPTIYTLDMTDPASFFLAQNFSMQDKDILYISEAPATDLQKFMSIIATGVFTVVAPVNALR